MDDRCFFERFSGHSALMSGMMKRTGANCAAIQKLDGGLAWWAAEAKCIFCPDIEACKAWLAQDMPASDPKAFCPNVALFRSSNSPGT
jgi:hypothetical protein